MTERSLAVEHFIEYHSERPHVHFGRDFSGVVVLIVSDESLRRKIPIGSNSLRGEFYSSGPFVLNNLAQSEVGYFELSLVEYDVLWFLLNKEEESE